MDRKPTMVFLVMADADHECSHPLRAFLLKSSAEAFANGCRSYDVIKPECPQLIEDSPANDRLWDRWHRAERRWAKHHTAGAGIDTSDCLYSVREIALW